MGSATKRKGAFFHPGWLHEAINELSRYNREPFTVDFMNRHDLRTYVQKDRMLQLIQDSIKDQKHPLRFEDLVEYIDELKMWGNQSIIPYYLPYTEEEYLNRLRDSSYIKRILTELHLQNRFNKNKSKWVSSNPFLTGVEHHYNDIDKQGKLVFKWVQTRQYEERVGNIIKTLDERSVNFLIIDLADGSAQIRIQTLPSNSCTDLVKEVKLYTEEIGKIVDFKHFLTIPLRRVMSQFLYEETDIVNRLRARPGGQFIAAAGINQGFFRRILSLLRQRIMPYEISIKWECGQEVHNRKDLFFTIRAEENAIISRAMTDKARVNYIVMKIVKAARHLEIIPNGPVSVPPPPTILKDGLREVIKHKLTGTRHERLKKALTEVAIVPSLVISRFIMEALFNYLKDTIFETATNIPFIAVEILIYLIILLLFYGGKMFRNILKNWQRPIDMGFKLVTGHSLNLLLNENEFERQRAAGVV